MPENETIIELVNVYKEYRVGSIVTVALKNVNFKINKGDLLAIMGPSGSGKTTLLNMIGLLDRPTKGKIIFDGRDTSKLNDRELAYLRNAKLGFVFQAFNLVNRLTVFENIELPLIPRGLPRNVRAKMVEEALLKVGGDTSWLRKKPNQLSGGQQQRVAIARALANNPVIILADEPTGNLDLHTGLEIISLLREVNKEKGVTIIAATHDLKMIDVSDRIAYLRDGRIDRFETRAEVYVRAAE